MFLRNNETACILLILLPFRINWIDLNHLHSLVKVFFFFLVVTNCDGEHAAHTHTKPDALLASRLLPECWTFRSASAPRGFWTVDSTWLASNEWIGSSSSSCRCRESINGDTFPVMMVSSPLSLVPTEAVREDDSPWPRCAWVPPRACSDLLATTGRQRYAQPRNHLTPSPYPLLHLCNNKLHTFCLEPFSWVSVFCQNCLVPFCSSSAACLMTFYNIKIPQRQQITSTYKHNLHSDIYVHKLHL